VGLFYITGHGMPEQVGDDILKLAERFFREPPQAAKDAIHMKHSKHFRGYEPAAFLFIKPLQLRREKRFLIGITRLK
jgi:isopenicillin N synthase-like dioxygenase